MSFIFYQDGFSKILLQNGSDNLLLQESNSIILTASSGSFTLTGVSATLKKDSLLSVSSGTHTVSGTNVNITTNRILSSSSGIFTVSGSNTNLRYARTLQAEPGSYSLDGSSILFKIGFLINSSQGNFTITGNDVNFEHTGVVFGESGSYIITGNDVTLTYSQLNPPDPGTPTPSSKRSLSRGGIGGWVDQQRIVKLFEKVNITKKIKISLFELMKDDVKKKVLKRPLRDYTLKVQSARIGVSSSQVKLKHNRFILNKSIGITLRGFDIKALLTSKTVYRYEGLKSSPLNLLTGENLITNCEDLDVLVSFDHYLKVSNENQIQ